MNRCYNKLLPQWGKSKVVRMTSKYKTGDTAYIVANRIFVKEVTIIKYSGGLYTLRLSDTGGGLKLR